MIWLLACEMREILTNSPDLQLILTGIPHPTKMEVRFDDKKFNNEPRRFEFCLLLSKHLYCRLMLFVCRSDRCIAGQCYVLFYK